MAKDLKGEFEQWKTSVAGSAPTWMTSWQGYIEEALPLEVSKAKERGAPETPDVLVIVVGTSIEPVLIAAQALSPNKVVLLGSKGPVGTDALRDAKAALAALGFTPSSASFDSDDTSSAYVEVARVLREHRTKRVVVDVTGGKKSMSAAVFFGAADVAAEAGGQTEIVYQDADHDAKAGRPSPLSTKFVVLGNPVGKLGLDRLRRARTAWEKSQFVVASDELRAIIASSSAVLGDLGLLVGSKRARDYAAACVKWEGAAYSGLDLDAPVSGLTCAWDHGAPNHLAEFLGGNPGRPHLWPLEEILTYVNDAGGWLERRRDVDPRVRFLRWFALGELVIDGVFRQQVRVGTYFKTVEFEATQQEGKAEAGTVQREPLTADNVHRLAASEGFGMPKALATTSDSKGHFPSRLAVPRATPAAPESASDGEGKARDESVRGQVHWARDKRASCLPAGEWYREADSWRDRRNACAHGIGEVGEPELVEIAKAVQALVEAARNLIPEAVVHRSGTPAPWSAFFS